LASVQVALGDQGHIPATTLKLAAQALIAGGRLDLTGSEPTSLASEVTESAADPVNDAPPPSAPAVEVPVYATGRARTDSSEDALRIAGYALAGAGLAANVVGWGLQLRLQSLQSDYVQAVRARSPDRFEAFREVDSFDLPPKVTLGAGVALWTASLPLWLPTHQGIPWWAWLSGGAGLITAGIGTKLTLDAGSCVVDDFGRCTDPALATGLGIQLLLQSVPLLAVPVVYGLRTLLGRRESAQTDTRALHVQALQGGALVAWTGTL
jgi:hypothetical protein